MKIVCCLCGGDATIIDHHIGIYVGGVDEPYAEISMECPTCPNHLRQEVRVTKVTEEEILAHPRHYTQLRDDEYTPTAAGLWRKLRGQ